MFPKDFLWGASISAMQAEGSIDNRGLTFADLRSQQMNKDLGYADTSVAVDFYHHYKEDIQLMKECGFKSFRMSIAWSRIFPNNSTDINQEGVDFYHSVFDELNKNNIEPIVTLFHFDMPYWMAKKYNGFVSRQAINDFVAYSKFCFEEYGNKVKYWLTINEQTVLAFIPSLQGLKNFKETYQAFHHMSLANAKVIKLYHSMNLNGKIGPCISYSTTYPASCDPQDIRLAFFQDDLMVFSLCDVHMYGKYPQYFLNWLKEMNCEFKMELGDEEILKDAIPDFFGLNWYCTEVIGKYIEEDSFGNYDGPDMPRQSRTLKGVYQYYKNPHTPYSEYNWNNDGIGLHYSLRKMYDRYHIPLLITENGWSANETLGDDGKIHDIERIDYFKNMVEGMEEALNDGVELMGFNPWSFIDVTSSSQGMNKRYGLVFVDRTNEDIKECARIPKDSYYWYKETIEKYTK